jgi:hypothetical protein
MNDVTKLQDFFSRTGFKREGGKVAGLRVLYGIFLMKTRWKIQDFL